jgi:hypothetical protein
MTEQWKNNNVCFFLLVKHISNKHLLLGGIMTTKELILKYYDAVQKKAGWQSLIADLIKFTNEGKTSVGRNVFVESGEMFCHTVKSLTIKELFVEGNKACALVSYSLVSPKGKFGTFDVAEFLTVNDNKLDSSSLFYDSAAIKLFMSE